MLESAEVDHEKVVEFFARALGLELDAAREHLEFRLRAVAVLDELRAALGDRCGELWFWGGRLNVGVSDSDYPPEGAEVQAAKLVLENHGLLDRSDIVPASVGTSAVVSAMARVTAMLEGWTFARVSLQSPMADQGNTVARVGQGKRLVIETLDGLTEEQWALVDAAVAVAGVPVEVAASLGPGYRYAPTPLRETEWIVLSVGDDGRALRMSLQWSWSPAHQVSLFLNETESEIQITVAVPDLLRIPEDDRFGPYGLPSMAGWRPLTVHLESPVNGRRIMGPGQKLVTEPIGSAGGFTYEPTRAPDGEVRGLIPNVVGLASTDAVSVLHAQGFEPQPDGDGRQVTHQDPAASTISDKTNRRVKITLGP